MPWQIYFLESIVIGALLAVYIYEWRTSKHGRDKEDIDEKR